MYIYTYAEILLRICKCVQMCVCTYVFMCECVYGCVRVSVSERKIDTIPTNVLETLHALNRNIFKDTKIRDQMMTIEGV